jgi:small GTP-binding protein
MRNPTTSPAGLASTTVRLPTMLNDLRNILSSLDWDKMRDDVRREAAARLAIVGPVNAGKSTLFNLIEGHNIAETGPVPGTTKAPMSRQMGPFLLVDTPGFGEVGGVDRANIAARSAAEADAILLLLDAGGGLRQGDADLLRYLQTLRRPIVVTLNKIDLLGRDYARVSDDASAKLGVPVIPISARKGTNVAERLFPTLVDALPDLAVALGRELPAVRRSAAQKVIRNAAMVNTALGVEPIPFIDIPFLLTTQARMVLRIAAIYGESFTSRHAKELISTMAGGLTLRYLAAQGAKLIPAAGWAVGAGVAALGTWAIGQVALAYFESGKRLTPRQMRSMYKDMLKRKDTFEKESG